MLSIRPVSSTALWCVYIGLIHHCYLVRSARGQITFTPADDDICTFNVAAAGDADVDGAAAAAPDDAAGVAADNDLC